MSADVDLRIDVPDSPELRASLSEFLYKKYPGRILHRGVSDEWYLFKDIRMTDDESRDLVKILFAPDHVRVISRNANKPGMREVVEAIAVAVSAKRG